MGMGKNSSWTRRPSGRQRRGSARPALRGLRFEQLEPRQLLAGVAAGEGTPRPDLSLLDVNSASSTYQQAVSPRDYLEQVSGWYFANGT
ncbi:MAG: hypothetical protein GX575_06885 [Candidatus Anammoximicrobium sp.]|nr:hypothetical protein [Candidatus Anammoximicrobium sp.]